jgi:hypothetical protein
MPGGVRRATRVTRLWLCWACAWAAPIPAAQVDYGVGLSLTYEDNIDRTETNHRAEVTESVMGGIFFREENSDLNARVLAQLEHRHFVRATFSDDTTAYVDGAALWTISPRRLTWLLEDTFREVQLNLTTPDTPSNRAKSNSLNTGPDLILAVDSANSVSLGGRYGRFDIQNSLNDNVRYGGFLRGIHALSQQSRVSLNYEATRVNFLPEATPFPRILQQNFYGRYEALYAGGNGTTVDLGKTHITRYGGDNLDGHLARAAFLRGLTPQMSIRAGYSDEISDTYSDLIRGVTLSGVPLDPGVAVIQAGGLATTDLYHSTRGELAFLNQGPHFQYTLLGYGRKVDFQTLGEDYHEIGGRIGVNWIYSGTTRFNAYADYSKRAYQTLAIDGTQIQGDPLPTPPLRVDSDRNYIATADYKLNRNLTITLSGNFAQRDSNAPGVSFVDRRVMLLLAFSSSQQLEMKSRR